MLCASKALAPLGRALLINRETEARWLVQGHGAQGMTGKAEDLNRPL